MSAVAEIVRQRVEKLKADTTALYWQHVRESAAPGAEPDPDALADFLLDYDLDPEQFQADVEKVAARYAAASMLAGAPALQAQLAELDAEQLAANEAFDVLKVAHGKRIDALHARKLPLRERLGEVTAARSILLQGNPDDSLIERNRDLGRRLVAAELRRDDLRIRVRDKEIEAAVETKQAQLKGLAAQRQQFAEQVLPDRREQLAHAEAELAEIRRERAEVEALLLLP